MSGEEEQRKAGKPVLDCPRAISLAESHFGIDVVDVKELDSYDDCNFYVKTSSSEFLLKIYNSVDSRNEKLLIGRDALTSHLTARGLRVPVSVPTSSGERFAAITSRTTGGEQAECAVQLLEWVPGQLLADVPFTSDLCGQTGRYLAGLSCCLDSFDHEGLHRSHQWDMQCFLDVKAFTSCLSDPVHRELVDWVMERFQKDVLPQQSQFRKGILQADFNDSNIIIDANSQNVCGVIDFGDSVFSWRVADLAIALAYMAVSLSTPAIVEKSVGLPEGNEALFGASLFLSHFLAQYQLTECEAQCLSTLICARLATSAVLGWYSYTQNPQNEYLKKHSVPAWTALATLRAFIVAADAAGGAGFVDRLSQVARETTS